MVAKDQNILFVLVMHVLMEESGMKIYRNCSVQIAADAKEELQRKVRQWQESLDWGGG